MRINRWSHRNIEWQGHTVGCMFPNLWLQKNMWLPAPKPLDKKKDTSILDKSLDAGEIDFLCNFLHSVTSIEQLGHGESLIAAIVKWTHDVRLLK